MNAGNYPGAIGHFDRGLDSWRRITRHQRGEASLNEATTLQQQLGLPDTHPAGASATSLAGHFTQLAGRPPRNRDDRASAPCQSAGGHDA